MRKIGMRRRVPRASRKAVRDSEEAVWNSGKRRTSTISEKNANAAENTEFVDVSVEE